MTATAATVRDGRLKKIDDYVLRHTLFLVLATVCDVAKEGLAFELAELGDAELAIENAAADIVSGLAFELWPDSGSEPEEPLENVVASARASALTSAVLGKLLTDEGREYVT